MDDRWQRVNDLFHAALRRDAASRDAFVREASGGDTALAAAVRSLLAGYDHASSWLQASALVDRPAVPETPRAWKPGQRVGAYTIERELGRGGMGVVYLARDTRLGRKVALKALTPECTADGRQQERLRREACAAAALSHPGIATVYALEEHDGQLVMAREYVAGDTLRAEIEAGPIPPATVVEIGVEVARALAAAHGGGIVHRDLKPENVMRASGGGVKIVDFGIARVSAAAPVATTRLTDPGIVVGTPAYMAPEQIEGQETDPRTDVFALGVLLYELASGVHPFEGTTAVSTAARVLAADPPVLSRLNPGVPASLERVVLRCLQKRRENRYQSAGEVADDLDAIRRDVLAAARARPGARPDAVAALGARRWWRVHQVLVMVVYAAMLLPTWKMSDWLKTHWALGLLFAMMVVAAFNGTLRVHLLFTDRFNPAAIGRQVRQAAPLLRATDCLISLIFLAAAAPIARAHLPTAAILAAVGVVSMAVSFVVEPATAQAAFGRRLTEPRKRTTGQRAGGRK